LNSFVDRRSKSQRKGQIQQNSLLISLLALSLPPSILCAHRRLMSARRDFRVKMWGTSSPDDKLTGDLGNVIEAAQIGVRRSDRLTTRKTSQANFGVLQQYRLSAQSVDATQALNRSARVSKPKVSRDRSLSCRVTRLNCECAPPAVPQLLLLGHRVETSNVSSTHRYPLHLLRLR